MAARGTRSRPFPALRTSRGAHGSRAGLRFLAEGGAGARRRARPLVPVAAGVFRLRHRALSRRSASSRPCCSAVGATLLALALRMFFRATAFRLILGSTILVVALGFLTAKVHALLVEAPALAREHRFTQLEGWVERVEPHRKSASG